MNNTNETQLIFVSRRDLTAEHIAQLASHIGNCRVTAADVKSFEANELSNNPLAHSLNQSNRALKAIGEIWEIGWKNQIHLGPIKIATLQQILSDFDCKYALTAEGDWESARAVRRIVQSMYADDVAELFSSIGLTTVAWRY